MDPSPAVEARIREEVEKLSEFYDQIIGCRVMVEIPHQHRQTGNRFHIRIYLTVPGGEIVAKQEPSLHATVQDVEVEQRKKEQEVTAAHKDIFVAIRDAFKAARRQLQDFGREQRGEVKRHENRPRGAISQLFPEKGLGFIETVEGEELYFNKDSLLNNSFVTLTVGTAVDFVAKMGDKGLQASSVRVL